MRRSSRAGRSDFPVPKELGAALAVTTDDEGHASLSGLAPDELHVDAPGFGAQTMTIPTPGIPDSKAQPEIERTITLTLAYIGRVAGRLAAPGNEPIKGVMVKATIQVGGYAGSGQGGRADVGCDAEGRFEIPAIAAEPLTPCSLITRRTPAITASVQRREKPPLSHWLDRQCYNRREAGCSAPLNRLSRQDQPDALRPSPAALRGFVGSGRRYRLLDHGDMVASRRSARRQRGWCRGKRARGGRGKDP